MSEEDDERNVAETEAEVIGEGTPVPKSTPVEPPVTENWGEVEELPNADDSDYSDEEVEYIALDLGDDLPNALLKQVDSIQLTRLNLSDPWVRIGPCIMRGRHTRMLGSDLLFELPPADPDTGKPDNVLPIGTTQARVRFEPVEIHAKSYGNPRVPQQTASSYLAPKTLNREGGKRRGRHRRQNRERRHIAHDIAPNNDREGSTVSSTIAEEEADNDAEPAEVGLTQDRQDDEQVQVPEDLPNIEEF